jgi:uncharacterized protein (TIGR03083 family)
MAGSEDVERQWRLVREQRLALAEALSPLRDEGWDQPSLCTGWRVRDVVGHLVGNSEGALTPRKALPGLIRHRFNVDRFLDADARARGATPPAELLARLRSGAEGRRLPPGRQPADVLADAIIHTQDVLRPLGIDRHASPEALVIALRRSVPQGPPLRTKERSEGLRLRATDVDWSWGDHGEAVQGPAESLLLALCGRAAAIGDLAGPGADVLNRRCTPGLAGAGR